MALGAAIGGFADGVAKGLKLRSDLEDAETRRGLVGLQKQEAQLKLDRETQMKELQTQLFQETKDWQGGQGSYAPGEGGMYDPASDQAATMHYQRIQPLLEQQAMLAGKSPLEVRQTLKTMEQDRYAQTTMRAAQLVQTGDPSGIELLKGSYNKMYRDGRNLEGGTFNPETDTFTLNYVDKDGTTKTHDVKRDALANQYLLGALNPADAAKSMMRDRELKEGRAFEGGENEKNRGLKRELNKDDNAAALQRTQIGAAATKYSADRGVDARNNSRADAQQAKDYDDFQTQINDALGWNKNNPLVTQEQLASRNRDAAFMTGIWNTTRDVGGKKLSAYEAAQVVKGIENKTAKTVQRDGYTIVDVGGIRAILPK